MLASRQKTTHTVVQPRRLGYYFLRFVETQALYNNIKIFFPLFFNKVSRSIISLYKRRIYKENNSMKQGPLRSK
jgi:hypothetical protein